MDLDEEEVLDGALGAAWDSVSGVVPHPGPI